VKSHANTKPVQKYENQHFERNTGVYDGISKKYQQRQDHVVNQYGDNAYKVDERALYQMEKNRGYQPNLDASRMTINSQSRFENRFDAQKQYNINVQNRTKDAF